MPEPLFPLAGRRVFVAGHRGLVGAALVDRLAQEECTILTVGRENVDLRRQDEVELWFSAMRPDVVFLAAAKVGGILANRDHPGAFLYDNLMIAANVVEAARVTGTQRLIFLGSSCIYPRAAPQPIPESALLTGPLEPTNEAYAIAKIAGLNLVAAYRAQYGRHYISAQPTNLYGPRDNFDAEGSHVIPALLRRFHTAVTTKAPEVVIWGSGTPLREFLHVDDLADALVFLAKHYDDPEPINVGSGDEVSIRTLAEMIATTAGYRGELRFDTSRPDGTPRKIVERTRLERMGWQRRIPLVEGLAATYAWFANAGAAARGLAGAA